MAMEPGAAPDQGGGGGASQLLADAHSNLLKVQELMGDKMPAESEQLGAIVSAIQAFAEGMGQPAGSPPQGPAQPGTTSPEAGAANVKPAM
jgi:hypothetical protein